jgi:hypothetical protein
MSRCAFDRSNIGAWRGAPFSLLAVARFVSTIRTFVAESLVSELRSLNLLRVQEGGIQMPDHGEVLLELTPIGQRFVERFIEGNM